MSKIYRHIAAGSDEQIGHIEPEHGYVYSARFGPDKYIGWVNYEKGYVYSHRLGPDKYLGWVDMSNGKIYASRLGPDQYLGQVERDGKLYRHVSGGRDTYLGTLTDMRHLVEGAAALLLFFNEAVEPDEIESNSDSADKTQGKGN